MFTARVVKKHWILCITRTGANPSARLLNFGKNHEWQFAHISEQGDFVLINSLKELYLIQWDAHTTEFKLGNRIVLPKGISHGYSENQRLYMFDRAGDIYSQTFDELRRLIEENQTTDEICHDILLETSNFCAFLDVTYGNLLGHEVVAFSDQYYKIRAIERKDYHRMLMTTSLRTRYAETLYIYQNKGLLVYYDDGKMQYLDEEEILNSVNQDINYVSHPFVGHLKMYSMPTSNHILVHCLDSDDVHLCDFNEVKLELTSLRKEAMHANHITFSEVFSAGNHCYMVRVPEKSVETPGDLIEGHGKAFDLLPEKIDIAL